MQSADDPSNRIRNFVQKLQLDRIDFAILDRLQNEGRCSNKVLAAEVGLAPSSCLSRVKRLEDLGVITGYHGTVDGSKLGVGLEAMIDVRLTAHTRAAVQDFRDHLMTVTEVLAIYHVSGAFDFRIHVAVRDSGHLRDIALDSFTTHHAVSHIETHLIFEVVQRRKMPVYR